MIVVRAPYRIPLGGGGTDLPSYYSRYGGFLVTAAINKYIYVTINKRFESNIRVSHHMDIEIKNTKEELEHPVIKAAMQLLHFDDNIELVSVADIPPSTGMGSSASFTIGLLAALHAYRGDKISARDIAEEACEIEINILGRTGGKQDQYAGAFGGINIMEIATCGKVSMNPLKMPPGALSVLEDNLLLFFTGIMRQASDVLKAQSLATEQDNRSTVEALHSIKEIGKESRKALEQGNLRRFGELLDAHWKTKRRLSNQITTDRLDKLYNTAVQNGALGGKLMGAGGGGFFMFYCEGDARERVKKALIAEGLKPFQFNIDHEGLKVLYSSNHVL
jgi:D-glycero-alpha-D-manno-heptose-7-phosphate kinase